MPTNNTINGSTAADTLIGTSLNDRINGDAGDDILQGMDGDDELDGGAGVDTLAGGLGDDLYFLDDPMDEVIESTGEGTDEVRIQTLFPFDSINPLQNPSWVMPNAVENLTVQERGYFLGNSANNVMDASAINGGYTSFWGLDGDDTLIAGTNGYFNLQGGAGADVLIGGAGSSNAYFVDNAGDVVNASTSGQNAVWVLGGGNYTSTGNHQSISLLDSAGAVGITGDSQPNAIFGNEAANVLNGMAGDDLIGAGPGDVVIGGDGDDVIEVHESSIATGQVVIRQAGTNDVNNTLYVPIHYPTASLSRQGSDLLIAGYHFLGQYSEVLILNEFVNSQFSTITFTNYNLPANQPIAPVTLTRADIQNMSFTQRGTAGNDIMTGTTGPDVLEGLAGDDLYTVNDPGDHIVEDPGNGADTIQASICYTLPVNVENLNLIGADDLVGTGNSSDNTLDAQGITSPTAYLELYGGDGDDVLIGGPASINELHGGAGADVMVGSNVGVNIFFVDSAGDVVQADPNSHNVVHASIDYALGPNVDNLHLQNPLGGVGYGNARDNGIYGTQSNDVLHGGDGDDHLLGLSGNDHLLGDAGRDRLYGMTGDDVLEGGDGDDRFFFSPFIDHDTVALANAGDSNNTIVFQDIALSELVFTQDGDDLLITYQPVDPNAPGYGASMRVLGQYGQTGPQVGQLEFIDASMLPYLTIPIGQFQGWVNRPMFTGTANPDTLVGTPNPDALFGLGGDDTINGLGSGDLMVGGPGHDLYAVEDVGDQVIELAGEGVDTVQSTVSYTLGQNLENLTLQGTANLTGIGNAADNRLDGMATGGFSLALQGGAGNDRLTAGSATLNELDGGTGADVMIGSASGHSTFYVDDAGDQVQAQAGAFNTVHSTIDFFMGANQNHLHLQMLVGGGTGTGNALGNGIWGTQQNDTLYGMDGDDTLQGRAGDDFLFGGQGNDALYGGPGNDVLDGGAGDDTYFYYAGQGTHTITAAAPGDNNNTLVIQDGTVQTLNFVQSGQDLIISGPPPAAPAALDGAQQTVPPASQVVIAGHFSPAGSGISTLQIVSPTGVTQTFSSAQFSSWVNGSVYHGTSGDDTYNGTPDDESIYGYGGNDSLNGAAGNDHIEGGDGNDTLVGGSGADAMYGQLGDDFYQVDDLADTTVELPGEGTDTVNTLGSVPTWTLAAEIENLRLNPMASGGTGNALNNRIDGSMGVAVPMTLRGLGGDDTLLAGYLADTLEGGAGLDTLYGGSGNDTLVGGSGADAMYGQLGDDFYQVDDLGDTTIELPGEGIDTVSTLGSVPDWTLAPEIENLRLNPMSSSGTGNALNNSIDGSMVVAGAVTLRGLDGDDTLLGGYGADHLYGGAGNDTLTGGANADTFYYTVGEGSDTITAAAPGDNNNVLVIQDGTVQTLSFVQSGQDLIINGPPPAAPAALVGAQQTVPPASQIVIAGHFSPGGSGISTLQVVSPTGVTQTFSSAQFSSWVNGSVYHGTSGNDTYNGTPDDESIYGYGGNDSLSGAAGNDLIDGGDGDDTHLSGDQGNNTVHGGVGNDVLFRNVGNDTLDGGAGDDRFDIIAEAGGMITITSASNDSNNTLDWYFGNQSAFRYYHDGNDLVITVAHAQSPGAVPLDPSQPDYRPYFPQYGIALRVQDQFLSGHQQIANMTIYGFGSTTTYTAMDLATMATPVFTGTTGADTLVGLVGDDVLLGLGGNDVLIGSTGADAMYGQAGDDTYQVDNLGDTTVELPGEGIDTVNTLGSVPTWTLAAEIENLRLNPNATGGTGNALNNMIDGSMGVAGPMTLRGLDGDDTLLAGYGNDHLYGGAGNDTLNGGSGADSFYVEAGGGSDVIVAPAAGDSNNTLVIVNLDPALVSYSQQGQDLIVTYTPPSPMSGAGLGAPQASAPAVTSMRVSGQFDPNGGNVASVVFQQNGVTVQTLSAADIAALVAGGSNSNTQGDAGANRLEGTSGVDTMIGLAGDDVYVVNHADDQVIEAPNEGADTIEASLTLTLPGNVENLVLTGPGDLAGSGNDLANQLTGNSGSNWLSGEAGNDTLRGGAGNDDIRGGDGGDLLYGEDGDDVLDGGVGADFMAGGAGNDRYTVSEAGDVIDEAAGGGIDTVVANGDYVLYANLENLELLAGAINGSGNAGSNWIIGNADNNWIGGGDGGDTIFGRADNDTLNGDGGNDVLYGEAGDDMLDGGSGDDQLIGGDGNDRYIIRDLGDVITEDANGGIDTAEVYVDNYVPFANVENVILAAGILSASGSTADNWMEGNAGNNFLGGGLGHDALLGFDGNDYLKGDEGDDRLEGGEGDDTLEGNSGVDTMVGGNGNDTYYVDGPGDIIVETPTGGVDTVYSTGYYTLSGNLENLVIVGTQAVDGTGDAGSNWMRGNAEANVLSGVAGNDTIFGGDGADTLNGGIGNDVLDGEQGADSYVYALGDGEDTISDNDSTAGVADTLNFTGIARSLLSVTRSGDHLVIGVNDAANPGSVTISNWFAGSQYQIEQIVDADGARAAAVISALAAAPAPSAPAAAAVMHAEPALYLSVA